MTYGGPENLDDYVHFAERQLGDDQPFNPSVCFCRHRVPLAKGIDDYPSLASGRSERGGVVRKEHATAVRRAFTQATQIGRAHV